MAWRIVKITVRRRRWSAAEKERLVAATLEPGTSVTAIAREAGVQPGQPYGWRREARALVAIGFAPVQIASGTASSELASGGAIEIEFASGARDYGRRRCRDAGGRCATLVAGARR
jgi:transposase